ncbi:hypothetical protein R5R35_010407 [Gryllus longicercus]|uniref:Chitin-binding type-2 domain-containing protein n=1 Tax=Gryllus longicercus TaxID=2509291 RepID=A0AAN9VYM1_9ORTH
MRCSVDIIFGVLAALAILIEPSTSQRRSRLATGAGQPVEFDCPEEFGYYPHPTDCTQYYVCVFGGALLESCTGGLMYSHELQTCDWPRNVGCGGAGESATISTVRVTDPRTRQTTPTVQGTRAATQVTRDQVQQRQQQEEIAKHQLYADDLGPAEEIETDRQQRVYRGQPSTVGQVARDRDGLRHQPVTNSIPATRSSSADKVAVISFGNQQQTQNTQYRVEPSPASVSYVQQPALQASPSPPAYNNSQQYDTSQYDPYYSIYDEDVELYRDVDYTQYTGNQGQTNNQQFRGQSPYKQAPQQPEIQSQRNNGYVQPTYNTQNVYTQTAGTQDYNENYNTQLANDQIQYRQQAARQPTKAPPRQQTRQRAEANRSATQPTTRTTSTTTTTTTTTTAYNIPEEFQTLWNLPVENNPSSEPSLSTLSSTINPADSLSRSANVPESPLGSQRNILSPASVTEPKPASRRITLTASLSLDEPFATGRRSGSRGPNTSRRTSFSADELSSRSGSRRGSSEAVPVNVQSARSNKNVQRNQSPPRRVASKSFAIADVPSSDSQVLSRNSGIITVEDFVPLPSRVNNSETSARRSRVEAARISNVEVTQPTRGTQRKTESQDNASAPRAAKLVLESETPRQSVISAAGLKPTVESTFFSESDSESNSLTTQSLSRNTISQSEIVTPRVRSREGIQAKPCRDEVDSNSNTDCSEKPQLRVRPTTAPPDSQTTPGPTRGTSSGRNRGSPAYTASTASDTVNRGTPASVRTRPTLKPSTAIVPKAQEFIDIYRFPPRRPDSIYPTPQVDKTAAKCRKDVCLLPDCYCGGKDIPGGFEPEEIPQMVLLTFDDSANDLNKGLYHDLFETGRKNANGCPISATFYVSHEWTDYSHVQNLYAGGHEIASHSISHSFGEQFSQKKWTREIGGQREILAAYGGVKLEDVRGMRAPFLAIGGNKMFKMLYDSNFTYDSSMPVYENRPPSWPYTLDYKIFHDCMIPPCPTRSYPGVWEVPMVMWQDLNGGRCSMGDACSNPPTADGVYKMLIKNFERHYTTNRAPFGLFYHAAWFTQPHHKEGFEAFLDTIVNMQDVWLVTNWQAIQWMRDPTPLSRINSFQPWQCNYPDRPKKCNNPKVCNLWHKSGVRYMRTCQPCPDIYPWTGKTGVRNSRVDNEVIEE